jgi:hypothetical protein
MRSYPFEVNDDDNNTYTVDSDDYFQQVYVEVTGVTPSSGFHNGAQPAFYKMNDEQQQALLQDLPPCFRQHSSVWRPLRRSNSLLDARDDESLSQSIQRASPIIDRSHRDCPISPIPFHFETHDIAARKDAKRIYDDLNLNQDECQNFEDDLTLDQELVMIHEWLKSADVDGKFCPLGFGPSGRRPTPLFEDESVEEHTEIAFQVPRLERTA